ncbi:galactose mutarotase [bacterium]|nr:galactose mutarotase [bacterium]
MSAVTISKFGTTAKGEDVARIALTCEGLSVALLTRGAVLQSVRLAGVDHDLTLGSDNLADYEGKMRSHGSLVAPVVNRFTDGRATIGGKPYSFEKNQNGIHTLHSAGASTQAKVWALAASDATSATLALDLPDGEGNFPGNRHVEARFSLHPGHVLRMEVTATTDALTLFNAANHSYWNMDGSETWAGHSLQIAAATYLPTSETFAPTGTIADVTGTAMDFRRGRKITPSDTALDHNFCLSGGRQSLRDVLWLTGTSGLTMTVATTEAGIQVYDGRNAMRPGHTTYEGIAIEAQNWPDAPNHPGFPSIELKPGETYRQVTEWRFTRS